MTESVQRSPAAGHQPQAAAVDARAPSIRLPKGGGAIRGMGEKFAVNPVTGTGSMSVPITTSPGRSGFGPQLSLAYDSGSGNGPFGFGWSLSLPAITRKTDKGLPRYGDAGDSDVFLLSGAEDLVPVLVETGPGEWQRERPPNRTVNATTYRLDRYRPRIEGLFSRIERWTNIADPADVFWRAITQENITTWYGRTAESRIADPADASRIFSWLICQSYDDKGNVVAYGYKPENSDRMLADGAGNRLVKAHEHNRTDASRSAQRYLKRIRYGNRAPHYPALRDDAPWPEPSDTADAWCFEVVLDYGEHDPDAPTPGDNGQWPARPDPFSTYRAGFEVRTARLCRRVLMFHHFPGAAGVGRDCLVRSTDFRYSDDADPTGVPGPVYSFLNSVTHSGYRRTGDSPTGAGYEHRSVPPVEFEYAQPVVQDVVVELDPDSLDNVPSGLDGRSYRWTDLHGEGLPGILTEQAGAWFYKRNLSPVPQPDGSAPVRARFAALETVARAPNVAASARAGAGAVLVDLAGDGQPDLVVLTGPTPGLYEHDDAEGWKSFRPFTSMVDIDPQDANVRFVDLTGDGRADVLITADDTFVWHASLAEDGFGPARRVGQTLDEEKGPRVVFADGTGSISIADLSGDGLVDLVRIRNGEVCYWPNLGYGRFGAKVTMDNAPWFDDPDHFDHRRIRLADIDGSGTTDLIYLHREGVRLYFNQSGNSWSQPRVLAALPRIDDLAGVAPIDLLGNGTTCLVWSSPSAVEARRPLRYIDLMGGRKPHLLIGTSNNLGAQTRIEYAPSTKFYLLDRHDDRPWITRLPFPVHVVERVETYDHVSRNRFVSRYAYHHGHFDGDEREFRGFGMVEEWDTEAFATLSDGRAPAANLAAASHLPAVHTKTWFHTGVHMGPARVSNHHAGQEYFREPGDDDARGPLLPDTVLPAGLNVAEEREAARALKGWMLRQEVYAADTGAGAPADQVRRAGMPYAVTEQSFAVRTLQPRGPNRYAVFLSYRRETVSYHYERNPTDPRVQHTLTLEVDEFGNVLKEADIGYGRRARVRIVGDDGAVRYAGNPGLAGLHPADRAKQTTTLVTYTETEVTNAVESTDTHRTPLPSQMCTFELTGYTATGAAGRFQAADFTEPDLVEPGRLRHRFAEPELAYEESPSGAERRRPIERVRTLYRRDDLTGLLPLGQLQLLALAGESYRLAFTPGLLTQTFQRPRPGQEPEALLPDPAAVLGGQAGDRGGYVPSGQRRASGHFPDDDPDGHWWMPSGRTFYATDPAADGAAELAQARQHFFIPRRYRDCFGRDTAVAFDRDDLLIVETRDPLGNRYIVDTNDYRVLQPRLVSDANRNQTEVAFDVLGMVAGTAVMGKPRPAPVEGDSFAGFDTDLTPARLTEFFDADNPHTEAPALLKDATTRVVYDLDRFRRTRQAHPDDPASWQPAGAATLARETHANEPSPAQGLKIQISFSYSDGFGREVQRKIPAEPGRRDDADSRAAIVNPRWVADGWTVFNNKGLPIRRYEPFFTATHRFEFAVAVGVSSLLFYDPVERVVATLYPNHTYEKVVFDPWQQTSYDANDTCAARGRQTGDPRTDPDIGGYVAGYFATQPPDWQTWHAQRIDGGLGLAERDAARRAQGHADTPATAHLDAIGRTFLTVARNRVTCSGHDLDGREDSLASRIELDIEGNQRAVRDAVEQNGDPLGRVVMRAVHDMLGNRIFQLSMEAGARWNINDVDGKSIRSWDSRGHAFTSAYDPLRRLIEHTVRGTTPDSDPRTLDRDIVFDRIEYGEGQVDAEALNLRGRMYRHFDPAGVAVNARLDGDGAPVAAYDFKGNLLYSTRQLVSDYAAIPDWRQDPRLENERFESGTRYDGLNRPIQSVAPHSSRSGVGRNIIQPVFNDANLLERVDVWLERTTGPVALLDPDVEPPSPVGVTNVDYDAKGRRTRIDYANGASTTYAYDPLTFRLTDIRTRRTRPGRSVQKLHYTYDPAGNITAIGDRAQPEIFFRNQRIEPGNDYTYDALYRLIQATGREHLGQLASGERRPPTPTDGFNAFPTRLDHPGDGDAMGRYVERYVHDAAGNIVAMQHRGGDPGHPGWTRTCDFIEASLIEVGAGDKPPKASNRLTRTTISANRASSPQVEAYQYDRHGNLERLPHLGGGQPGPNLQWDFRDQLRQVDLGGGGQASYVYDAAGQRVRKVWRKAPGLIEERIYLGGFEVFRRHRGAIGSQTVKLERETLHVMDDQQRIALVETRTVDTAADDPAPRRQIRFQLGNHVGSVSLELDERAQVISYEEYAPYGSSTYQAVRRQTETAKRYRYTGKERDEESGLYYHGARYYACWEGRWVSCDPQGLADGTNLYAYVGGNPVGKLDPTGTDDKGTPNLGSAIDGALDRLDQPGNPFQVHGKSGLKEQKITLDIDEPKAVGEKGISRSEARARATDVNNRQFLDPATNRRTKFLGTDTHTSPGPGSVVSAAENPNALFTRRFGDVAELRNIFDEALSKIKEPGKLSPTALKARINSNIWDIIKNGSGESAVKVREALQKLGFENVPGEGFVMKGQPAAVTAAQGAAKATANEAKTAAGTEAKAAASEAKAVAKSEAKAVAGNEAKAVVKNEAKAAVAAEAKAGASAAARSESGLLARLGGAEGAFIKGLLVLNIYFAWDAYKDGTRANTPAPVGNGAIGGSRGEAILNAAGSLAGGGPGVGTTLRQSAELGSAVSDWGKLWNAIKGGSNPITVGQGIFFGYFR